MQIMLPPLQRRLKSHVALIATVRDRQSERERDRERGREREKTSYRSLRKIIE